MDGVTIIQTIDGNGFPAIICGILFTLIAIIIGVIAIMWRDREGSIALVLLFIGITMFVVGIREQNKVWYRVLIDDSVTMQEFSQHYEIIEQQGEAYLVREIENGDGD